MTHDLLPEMSEELLATILDVIDQGIWDWNLNTGYVSRSSTWYRILGYEDVSSEKSAYTWESRIHPDDHVFVKDYFNNYADGQANIYKLQYRSRTNDGDYLWIEDRGCAVEWDDDGKVTRVVGGHRVINDEKISENLNKMVVSELEEEIAFKAKELEHLNNQLEIKVKEAERLAKVDGLTQISNRFGFEERLKYEYARAKRTKEPLCLFALNIDHFRAINDSHGLSKGDFVLIKIAELLRSNYRETDVTARWGGDEFMVLLPNTPLNEASRLAEKIRTLLGELSVFTKYSVTASFGVAQLMSNEEPTGLIMRVDKAVYDSKSNGRNRVTVFE